MRKGTGEEEEGAVEAAGILGNLNTPELDFGKIVRDLELLPFLVAKLKVHIQPIPISVTLQGLSVCVDRTWLSMMICCWSWWFCVEHLARTRRVLFC